MRRQRNPNPSPFKWEGEVYDTDLDENVLVRADVAPRSRADQANGKNKTRIYVTVLDWPGEPWETSATVTIGDESQVTCSRFLKTAHPCQRSCCVHVKATLDLWRAWQGTYLGE